jgi:hypothetical protein
MAVNGGSIARVFQKIRDDIGVRRFEKKRSSILRMGNQGLEVPIT